MGQPVREAFMSVKRTLLPHMPDSVMSHYRLRRELFRARFGLRQASAPTEVNIEVLADRGHARRWLLATGDTCRTIDPSALGLVPRQMTVIPEDADVDDAARLFGRPGIDAAVAGRVEAPSWADRSAGLLVEPTAIVTRQAIIDEVGGLPDGPDPLPGLLARIIDAGHRIGLIPTVAATIDPERRDPIAGQAVVILAAVPLHDVGGGSRGAQIALELVRRGYHVTYVNRYPTYEDVDLGLRHIHPCLEQVGFTRFNADLLAQRCVDGGGLVIVEIPDPGYESALTSLRAAGWQVVFDIIDDWSDPALGGEWYDTGFETDLITEADAVVGSAPDLVDRADTAGRSDAALVPNAVNGSVFGGETRVRPPDLPDGPLIGYHGSLYGDWFDWDGLRAVARANPDATVILIGEARGVPKDVPDNVVFLGLKAQGDLPAYLKNLGVGLVPFTVTPTTHAVSPLKVFEYLACGVPVAAPPLRALEGVDGVVLDRDLVAAVAAARSGPRPDPEAALRDHSWGARLEVLFDAVGETLADVTGPSVQIARRPVVHYRWRDRRISQ
jgi:glycosyltransferase involved in cell wall biosynthesis